MVEYQRCRGDRRRPGPGAALAAVYAVFALAAGARAAVQLAVAPERAPFAYGCSALAAGVYLVAAVALRQPGDRALLIVRWSCATELVGVLAVGALSIAAPAWFPDDAVWSRFGSGYGHLPVALPLLGLWWTKTRAPDRVDALGP